MIWKKLFGGTDAAQASAPPPAQPDEDPVGWVPVNDLEQTMAQIPYSIAAQFAFARQLLESDVLLGSAQAPQHEGPRTLAENTDFQIYTVDNNLGGTAAAIFTSENRLVDAFGEGAPYIGLNGRVALETVAQIGAIINPGNGLYVTYTPEVIARILSGDI